MIIWIKRIFGGGKKFKIEKVDDSTRLEIIGGQLAIKSSPEAKPMPLLMDGDVLVEISDETKILVARKISRLLPELVIAKKVELAEYTTKVLNVLCQEQFALIRQAIAEELKDFDVAPRGIVITLAGDKVEEVATPVLQFSPVLTDNDLIEILTKSEIPGVVEAISKRRRISSLLSGAIVRNGNINAVKNILSNHQAAFTEVSLEEVADKAGHIELWQAPLLERPDLTQGVVNRIGSFVSAELVRKLKEDGKIPEILALELNNAIQTRLRSDSSRTKLDAAKKAREMYAAQTLTAEVINEAIDMNDKEFAIEAVGLLAGYTREITDKFLKSDNPKAVTALAWKAGLSMRTAHQMQLKLAGIHHRHALLPKDGFDYPIAPERMQHYLHFYTNIAES